MIILRQRWDHQWLLNQIAAEEIAKSPQPPSGWGLWGDVWIRHIGPVKCEVAPGEKVRLFTTFLGHRHEWFIGPALLKMKGNMRRNIDMSGSVMPDQVCRAIENRLRKIVLEMSVSLGASGSYEDSL